ncbi:hypothetical protein EJ04DRAFT_575757 [Polyplosphaeria fusca]|uniref:Uncharacterized protein n=1 Tax=Polyplosphaeria fusca TaxID=682080 RepID=A0A9P4R309_9PLEO|nr:hypothetical protein EJ04DRAFT_575757 [Polyplosphaeria fusca]
MKRKFSFNLAPVKVAHSKPDVSAKNTPEPTPSHTHRPEHRREPSKESEISLNSPFINRRSLSPKVEQELRAACAVILQDFKPSDHVFTEEAKRAAEIEKLKRKQYQQQHQQQQQQMHQQRQEQRQDANAVRVHRPTGAPQEPRSAHEARQPPKRVDSGVKVKPYPELPVQANTARRRTENGEEQDLRLSIKSPSSDTSRSAAARHEIDSDDGTSVTTPLTGSTDNANNGSTAPTTVAMTSSMSSKRASHQFDNAAAVADAQAAEWMRHELERRRHQMGSQVPIEQKAPARPPSRARSIKSEIKEYIFPGSRSLSRTQSRESLRSNGAASSNEQRAGTSYGWRSWGLQRKSSSRSSSRPTTSKGRIESSEPEKKEINLNRELPPLPSLDSWDKQEQIKQELPKKEQPKREYRKSGVQGAHIATMMRSQEQSQGQQDYAAAVRRHHRRSGSDTLAMRYSNSQSNKPAPHPVRSSSHLKAQAQATDAQRRSFHPTASSMDFDQMMSAMDSPGFDEQLRLRVNGHAHQRSTSTASRSPSKMSSDQSRTSAAPNFSRKISTDVAPIDPMDYYPFQNVVQIKAHNQEIKCDNKGKLRRVFSGWMLRKEKRGDWMQKVEKQGIKEGIMIQDQPALPPVIRY